MPTSIPFSPHHYFDHSHGKECSTPFKPQPKFSPFSNSFLHTSFSILVILVFLQLTCPVSSISPYSSSSSSSSLLIYRRPSARLLQATQSGTGESESRKIIGLPPSGKPIHDPSKLGGTAKLNDKCDLDLHQKYGKRIYEILAKGEDSTTVETEFMNFLNQNSSFEYYRKLSCFGYSALQFAGSSSSGSSGPENYGSILNFYKCDPKKRVCLCYDEKPLKHINDLDVPTGCRLEDCQYGQTCDPAKYEGVYSKVYEGNLKQLTSAKTEEEHQKAIEKLYKDRGDYFLLNDANFASMQSVCESENLNLECKKAATGNEGKCECRNLAQVPNFKFKLKSTDSVKICEAESGSWCNFRDVRKQGICEEKTKCEQIFGDYSKLSACGGAKAWCRRKEESKQNQKCSFNPNAGEIIKVKSLSMFFFFPFMFLYFKF